MSSSHGVPVSGNLLIDHQHGHLTELIRSAANCARGHGDGSGFRRAVQAFAAALSAHFAHEGVILRGAGYGDAHEHHATHRAILKRFDAILGGLHDLAGSEARHLLVDEMERILFDHELREDAGYWDTLRENGRAAALTWEDRLEIGIDWIDEQHRHLVALIAELAAAGAQAGRETVIAELMERFLRHARQHFAAEERLLDSWGRPVSSHRAEHVRLLDEIDDLTLAVGSNPRVLVDHYLRFWIIDHIKDQDMRDFADQPVSVG